MCCEIDPNEARHPLFHVLARIPPDDRAALLIGDGSGTRYSRWPLKQPSVLVEAGMVVTFQDALMQEGAWVGVHNYARIIVTLDSCSG